MNSLLNKFYIKKKLLDKPNNVILLKDKVNNYNDVLNLFNNYKKTKHIKNSFINVLFSMHISRENHIFLYHSEYKNDCLIMSKFNNNYYNCTIPYLESNKKMENLKKTNFVAYYE
jgi:hypothetical protein